MMSHFFFINYSNTINNENGRRPEDCLNDGSSNVADLNASQSESTEVITQNDLDNLKKNSSKNI